MKRQKLPTWNETIRKFWWAVPVLLVCALFWWFQEAQSYPYEIIYTDPYQYIDTLEWRVTIDTTQVDSQYCTDPDTSAPCTCSFEASEDSVYFLWLREYIQGVGWTGWQGPTPLPRWSGGTVTIDYDSIVIHINDGVGPYTVNVKVLDTSVTPNEPVAGALVYFKDVTLGQTLFRDRTDASGDASFSTDADSVAVWAYHLPYFVFPSVWDTIATDTTTYDSILGYSYPDTAGSATDRTCWVKIYVVDNNGTAAEGVLVSMSPAARGNLIDSAGHVIVPSVRTDRTDSLGIAGFLCMWSSYFIPETKWNVSVGLPGMGALTKTITVPRDTVYTVQLSDWR